MNGLIKYVTDVLHLDDKKKAKKKKKEPEKAHPGSVYRDYRGVDGAVNDAERGKKK